MNHHHPEPKQIKQVDNTLSPPSPHLTSLHHLLNHRHQNKQTHQKAHTRKTTPPPFSPESDEFSMRQIEYTLKTKNSSLTLNSPHFLPRQLHWSPTPNYSPNSETLNTTTTKWAPNTPPPPPPQQQLLLLHHQILTENSSPRNPEDPPKTC